MPRYKPRERHSLLLPVVLSEQIEPGSCAFALQYLVDRELDLSELDACEESRGSFETSTDAPWAPRG